VQRASAKKVNVEVLDGLPAVAASIDHRPIAIGEIFMARDFCDSGNEFAEEWSVALGGFCERSYMFARRDKYMYRRRRFDVSEGKGIFILVDDSGGNASVYDLAKETAHEKISFIISVLKLMTR
jgi:hypothetical protein